ncbi:uncharacterized protein LOC110435948 [Sorghum bicolor]|uniref:uncharacterized protein LOC110435948 n=1 Tax=Sorghum bicolor TaxID=4558 RepID=UPI000B423A15|nr:uncharacterized protein LOC110435948 [Sorghum bicolor]|eukprot:XP_021317736.1 uncharacterized protein LOC110435948 [Sorghum bicolor]
MVVPSDKFIQHLCRKGKTTQNVMAACDFDMVFTFVLAGWPGSVHDMRVFDDAMTTYKDELGGALGKYYLVDSGYPNRPSDFDRLDRNVNFVHLEAYMDQPECVRAPTSAECEQMNAFRDSIANGLYNRS